MRKITLFVGAWTDLGLEDVQIRLDGRSSILAPHLDFGNRRRGWDFRSPGHGQAPFEEILRELTAIGYRGPLSVEWEDNGTDRLAGARDALAFARRIDYEPSAPSFDRQPKYSEK
ncbi:MAG: TIM barrel protein [Planctomycetota bacterium]|jgi:sugar phosphate isomerase/epimerase|nr:TIM barrel protein [Planctomycetota bacterium]